LPPPPGEPSQAAISRLHAARAFKLARMRRLGREMSLVQARLRDSFDAQGLLIGTAGAALDALLLRGGASAEHALAAVSSRLCQLYAAVGASMRRRRRRATRDDGGGGGSGSDGEEAAFATATAAAEHARGAEPPGGDDEEEEEEEEGARAVGALDVLPAGGRDQGGQGVQVKAGDEAAADASAAALLRAASSACREWLLSGRSGGDSEGGTSDLAPPAALLEALEAAASAAVDAAGTAASRGAAPGDALMRALPVQQQRQPRASGAAAPAALLVAGPHGFPAFDRLLLLMDTLMARTGEGGGAATGDGDAGGAAGDAAALGALDGDGSAEIEDEGGEEDVECDGGAEDDVGGVGGGIGGAGSESAFGTEAPAPPGWGPGVAQLEAAMGRLRRAAAAAVHDRRSARLMMATVRRAFSYHRAALRSAFVRCVAVVAAVEAADGGGAVGAEAGTDSWGCAPREVRSPSGALPSLLLGYGGALCAAGRSARSIARCASRLAALVASDSSNAAAAADLAARRDETDAEARAREGCGGGAAAASLLPHSTSIH